MWDDKHLPERRRVAQRLRELRLARGLTQADLSRRMGFAYPSSISSIEHGRRPIYEDELPILAAALGCTVHDLVPEPRDPSSPYPVARGKRLMPLAVLVILSHLVAGGAKAEEHASGALRLSGQDHPGQDSAPLPDPASPGRTEQPQPPPPSFWGDNCDPTLPPPRAYIGS